jgi:hypothetical protein
MKSTVRHGFALMLAAGLMWGAALADSGEGSGGMSEVWNLGVGGVFGSNFGGGYTLERGDTRTVIRAPYYGAGAELIFAAKYAEATVGVMLAQGGWDAVNYLKEEAGWKKDDSWLDSVNTVTTVGLRLGLWLKYPYYLTSAESNASNIFPIVGVDYEICFSANNDTPVAKNGAYDMGLKSEDHYDLSRFWFKLGVGADISLGDWVYLHPVVLYGIGPSSKFEKERFDEEKFKDSRVSGGVRLSHGLIAKFGVCYRFELD